jgi:hypothetical protein
LASTFASGETSWGTGVGQTAAVFVNEPAEYVNPFDMSHRLGGGCDMGRCDRNVKVDVAVRAGGVVVVDYAVTTHWRWPLSPSAV